MRPTGRPRTPVKDQPQGTTGLREDRAVTVARDSGLSKKGEREAEAVPGRGRGIRRKGVLEVASAPLRVPSHRSEVPYAAHDHDPVRPAMPPMRGAKGLVGVSQERAGARHPSQSAETPLGGGPNGRFGASRPRTAAPRSRTPTSTTRERS